MQRNTYFLPALTFTKSVFGKHLWPHKWWFNVAPPFSKPQLTQVLLQFWRCFCRNCSGRSGQLWMKAGPAARQRKILLGIKSSAFIQVNNRVTLDSSVRNEHTLAPPRVLIYKITSCRTETCRWYKSVSCTYGHVPMRGLHTQNTEDKFQ